MKIDVIYLRNDAPERLHVDGGLEHQKNMGVVIGIKRFAIGTKALSTEGKLVPLPDDTHHMPVAERKGMRKFAKIG
jgi:hypothetical protein